MDIERELERVIEKNKDRKYSTFETRVDLVAQDCLQEIRRLKQIIEFYQETSQWKSVEDESFEEYDEGDVLTYDLKGLVEAFEACRIKGWNNRHPEQKITYWMPLPNPPKERR